MKQQCKHCRNWFSKKGLGPHLRSCPQRPAAAPGNALKVVKRSERNRTGGNKFFSLWTLEKVWTNHKNLLCISFIGRTNNRVLHERAGGPPAAHAVCEDARRWCPGIFLKKIPSIFLLCLFHIYVFIFLLLERLIFFF